MDFLFSDKPAAIVGFAYGFIDSMCSNKNSLDSPLSSVVVASINGLVYGFGAGLISSIVIPGPAKPILPIVLVMATIKKHHELIPGIVNDIKFGSSKALDDIQNNGGQKLTNVINDVKDTTSELITKGKEKLSEL